MSATAVILAANAIGTVVFGAALVAVIAMPVSPGGFMRNGVKLLAGGAMAIYLFVSFSHVLQFSGVTSAFDIFENYIKVLFIPLLASAAYALRVNEQLRITERQARVLSAEHDMLMRVVDTTPTGMVVLDWSGRIEFANEKAKDILEVDEDPKTGVLRTGEWTCGGDPNPEPGVMRPCLGETPVRDVTRTIWWPDGRSRDIKLNATPIVAADGSVVGAVVAFTAAEVRASA